LNFAPDCNYRPQLLNSTLALISGLGLETSGLGLEALGLGLA